MNTLTWMHILAECPRPSKYSFQNIEQKNGDGKLYYYQILDILNQLESSGLVKFVNSNDSWMTKRVKLTIKGRKVRDACRIIINEMNT